jgi:hypothetical protein
MAILAFLKTSNIDMVHLNHLYKYVGVAPRRRYQLKTKAIGKSRLYLSLDPPRIPLKKGDFELTPVPPLLRGSRGQAKGGSNF